MKAHAKLSPSASGRWINCPGSVNLIDDLYAAGKIKPNQTSIFADEGSAAHELAELVLSGTITKPFEMEGKVLEYENAITVDREMCSHVQGYIDFVRQFKGELLVEQRVSFTDWVKDGSGTSDAIVIQDDRIVCIDLKYGKGVRVDAQDNTQAICYALGAVQGLKPTIRKKIKSVLVVIYQPRLDHVSEWELSYDDLMRYGEKIALAAEATESPEAPLVVGKEQCQFCPAKPYCKANEKFTHDAVVSDFDDLTQPKAPNILSDDEMRKALDAKPIIEAWLSAIEKHVTEMLNDGVAFDGYKLVEGRSLRAWQDEGLAADVLESALGDDAYTKKLLSPAQAEKTLGKKLAASVADLIVKRDGKPTLVHESDPRPNINITVDDF